MYVPSAFAETRLDVLHALIRRHAFATLVTAGEHGPVATHVPTLLLPDRGARGTLQTHLARQNDHCHALASGAPVLAVFHGPHGYVSPTWYANPLSVPTWNYVVVHARGTPSLMSEDALRDHLDGLVAAYEGDPPDGWTADRLPADMADKLRRAVVGFDIEIAHLEGKWKLGQNRSRADREGAIRGLRAQGTPDALTLADWMAGTLDSDPRGG